MLFAARNQTILASSLPRGWPPTLPGDWVAAGVKRGRADGWPRALYCVRLLEQRTLSSPEDRLAFLAGATIAANEEALVGSCGPDRRRVVLAGAPALMKAWAGVLRQRGLDPEPLDDEEREAAFRSGCGGVLAAGSLESAPGGGGVSWRPPR
jgi:2-keto-3-deoxy-galactonokinase